VLENTLMGIRLKRWMCITHPLPPLKRGADKTPAKKNKKLSETPCPSVVKKKKNNIIN
jgi:hypothetical protein